MLENELKHGVLRTGLSVISRSIRSGGINRVAGCWRSGVDVLLPLSSADFTVALVSGIPLFTAFSLNEWFFFCGGVLLLVHALHTMLLSETSGSTNVTFCAGVALIIFPVFVVAVLGVMRGFFDEEAFVTDLVCLGITYFLDSGFCDACDWLLLHVLVGLCPAAGSLIACPVANLG